MLSGAGVSAESGINTFRDSDGLWENHRIEDVATPEGWRRNPVLVNAFYNARRAQLDEVEPNAGHRALVELEEKFEVIVVTQNVDDLHERAGSTHVIHLHGELRKVRSSRVESDVRTWHGPLTSSDLCAVGQALRPHIVWFGEEVPELEAAAEILQDAAVVIVVGTSLQVYPAAGLVDFAPEDADIYYIDKNPAPNEALSRRGRLKIITASSASALPTLVKTLLAT